MKALDLFAGCGGATLGLKRAGIEVVADYERDADACATLAAAGLNPVQCDLYDLPGSALPRVLFWWASPPCQPFSAAGKRAGEYDERDGYPHVLRLIEEAGAPEWLVVENVGGLLHAKHAAYWRSVQAGLRAHFSWVEWRLLDAADYGVPQHRRRVITVCGPRPIVWPHPTHGPGRGLPWVTMGEALELSGPRVEGNGALSQSQRELDVNKAAPTISAGGQSHHAPYVRVIGGGRNTRGHPELRADPGKPAPTLRSGGAGHSAPGMYMVEKPLWQYRASEPARTVGTKANASIAFPSPTILASEMKGSAGDQRRASRALRRRLTVEECLTLQDLEGHPVQGATKTSRYRQAGNAVPPRLAEVVARAVLEAAAECAA